MGGIWLLARSEAVRAIGPEIEFHGYRVQDLDASIPSPIRSGTGDPRLVILEAGLDDAALIAWVRDAAALPGRPGVLVLDRGIDPIDRIVALEAGADDCVAWPCAPRELVARIRAISRRWHPVAEPVAEIGVAASAALSFAGWTLDRQKRRLHRPRQVDMILPVAEFAVLDELLRSPRRIVARKALLEATTPLDGPETRSPRAIDIQVSRLRRRLEIDGAEIIRTVRGRGYMLIAAVASI